MIFLVWCEFLYRLDFVSRSEYIRIGIEMCLQILCSPQKEPTRWEDLRLWILFEGSLSSSQDTSIFNTATHDSLFKVSSYDVPIFLQHIRLCISQSHKSISAFHGITLHTHSSMSCHILIAVMLHMTCIFLASFGSLGKTIIPNSSRQTRQAGKLWLMWQHIQ